MALLNRRSLLGLSPLEIVALGSVCHREAYLCEKPDFPSLPTCVYLFNTRLRPVSDEPLLRPWHSAHLSLDSLQVSDRVSSFPLPLSRPPLREACLRLLNGDSGSGLSPEVFPAVSSQPFDIDAPRQIFSCLEPRRLPCGRPLGVLRVFPWSHAAPCGATRASWFPWRSP
jgi:hypothetical protein